ncbi:MAG: HesA/MoeB/ThiF family protein [Pseudomonadota bacterium]
MSRYARQIALPEVGEQGQTILKNKVALVVGAGGLAANVLPLLAGAGLRRVIIVDGDRIENSNLHRQTLFTEADAGLLKAEVAALRCMALNSVVDAVAVSASLTPETAIHLVASADIVLDCADSYAVSYILSDTCRMAKVPLISASALAFGGYAGGFCATAPSLRAVFPEAPQNAASCASSGVMGPVVAMLGAVQAQLALSHLLRLTPSPLGQLLQVDFRHFRLSSFRFDKAPEPDTAFPYLARNQISDIDVIVDLRSADEAPDPIDTRAIRLAPDDLSAWLRPTNARLVLACASGLRAWRAAENLQHDWPGEIALMAASAS